MNLIKNATRALESSADKRLTITVKHEAQRVLVQVEDSGPGVAAADLACFGRFHPAPESTGLGLYISRALVRGFRGDLSYEPRSKGSCFTITLAVADREFEPPRRDRGLVRLLLLDDHTLFRESLSRLLDAEADFEMVAHCASIDQAIEILGKESVDVVPARLRPR